MRRSTHTLKSKPRALGVWQAVECWFVLRWEAHDCPAYDPHGGFEREVGRLLYDEKRRAERKAENDYWFGSPTTSTPE